MISRVCYEVVMHHIDVNLTKLPHVLFITVKLAALMQ